MFNPAGSVCLEFGREGKGLCPLAVADNLHDARLAQQRLEIGNRFRQPLFERRGRLPAKDLLRLCNVRLALPWVILRQRPMDNAASARPSIQNDIGKLQHREFNGIADVDRADNLVR